MTPDVLQQLLDDLGLVPPLVPSQQIFAQAIQSAPMSENVRTPGELESTAEAAAAARLADVTRSGAIQQDVRAQPGAFTYYGDPAARSSGHSFVQPVDPRNATHKALADEWNIDMQRRLAQSRRLTAPSPYDVPAVDNNFRLPPLPRYGGPR